MTTRTLTLAAIIALAAAGRAAAQQPADTGSHAQPAPDGAALYARNCASCHGPRGTPSAAMARSMNLQDLAAASTASVPDSVWSDAILNGKGRGMPSYKAKLTAEQVAAVLAYIRTLRAAP
ncbi:MAG TPA: cytochrome c [Gemmatimonadales bacterium]|nr:cytochrome c [Gemmatimonadales bacterium]